MAELISGHIACQILGPTTYNAQDWLLARHLLKWLGHRWPEHLTREQEPANDCRERQREEN